MIPKELDPMIEQAVRTTAQARAHMGRRLYWDEVSSRYVFLRSGVVTDVTNGWVEFDGSQDPKRIRGIPGLRNYELGGAWKANKEAK